MAVASSSRLSFLVAVALIAAAVTDPVVESIANTGMLGGHYADRNHLSVVPVLLAGSTFAAANLVLRCVDMWRKKARASDWLVDVAKVASKRSPLRDLPYVFVMQLAALFLMESAEQVVLGGKLLGGTAWLGGPILFSLLVHALAGAGCLLTLTAFMRALTRTFASFVRSVIRFVWLSAARASGRARFGRRATPFLRAGSAHVRQIGGRAPPLLLTRA